MSPASENPTSTSERRPAQFGSNTTAQNKKVVREFYDLAFNQRQPGQAAAK